MRHISSVTLERIEELAVQANIKKTSDVATASGTIKALIDDSAMSVAAVRFAYLIATELGANCMTD